MRETYLLLRAEDSYGETMNKLAAVHTAAVFVLAGPEVSPARGGGDIEVFVYHIFVCAAAKIKNNKEERIMNNSGVREADKL